MHARNTFAVLRTAFKGYGWYLVAMVLLGTFTAAIDGASIASIIPIVSSLLPGGAEAGGVISHGMQTVFEFLHIPFQFRFMILFLSFLILARAVLMSLFLGFRGIMGSKYLAQQIEETYGLLMHARWQFILGEKTGHLQNIILWDTKRAGSLLDGVVQFLQSVSGFLIYLAVAIVVSPSITVVTVGAGAVLALVIRPLMRRTRAFSVTSSQLEKDLSQHISEHVIAFKAVKASGAVDESFAVARGSIENFRKTLAKSTIVQSLSSVVIQPFGFLLAMAIFAYTYYHGTFSIPVFAATIYLIQKIFTYLDSTQASYGTVLQFVPFAEQIINFKERAREAREETVRGAGNPFVFEKEITFQNVSLRYNDDVLVLKDVSFSIEKGKMCAFVGPSGSGKTSLADLLLRLFTPQKGALLVDGIDARDISLKEWRKRVAYVSQDAFLLHATVRENIRFYDRSVSDEDVELAARQAHIYDEIMRLPEGFATVLGDRGATVSGGQRQRIALARALARKPEVLVLDEVTSALDSELEAQIKAVIEELHGSLTLVVIAHRVSTVLDADKIVVVKDGDLEALGKPQDMLADPNSYLSRILEMQGK